MRGRHVLAVVVLLGAASVAGCSADEDPSSGACIWTKDDDGGLTPGCPERAADSLEPVLIESGGWTLKAAYIDSKGRDDVKDGDRVRVEATIPNRVKGECARSPLPVDECYQSALDGQIRAAEKRGDLPGVGCSEVREVHHGPTAFGEVGIWCKVGWNAVEHDREYPLVPVAEPIQFASDGTVWLRIAEDGRDASCTLLRLPNRRQECVAATPEQVALIYPRVIEVVGYEQSEGGGWTSGRYLVLRVRGERS